MTEYCCWANNWCYDESLWHGIHSRSVTPAFHSDCTMTVTVEDCWLGYSPVTLISINFARECALTLICVNIDTLITDTQWTEVQCPCQWKNSPLLTWNIVSRTMKFCHSTPDSLADLSLLSNVAKFTDCIFAEVVRHDFSRSWLATIPRSIVTSLTMSSPTLYCLTGKQSSTLKRHCFVYLRRDGDDTGYGDGLVSVDTRESPP